MWIGLTVSAAVTEHVTILSMVASGTEGLNFTAIYLRDTALESAPAMSLAASAP